MPVPYESALHVTMTGNAMAGMSALIAKINEGDKATKNLVKSLELIAAGGLLEKIGGKIKDAFKTVLDAAGNFQQVQNQLAAMGDTQTEIAKATGDAWKLAASHIHVGVQELIEMNRHANEIFGTAGAASEHMPLMADLADWQHRWQAGHSGVKTLDVVTSVRDILKAAEQGIVWDKNTPNAFEEFTKKLVTGLVASGTNVSPTMYLKTLQSAKGSYATLSDSYKFGVLPALIQEMGSGAGVGMATAYAKLGTGARWTKQGIITGQELGVIDQSVDSRHPFTMRPENIAGNELYRTDPLEWYNKYLKPKLDAMYGEDLAAKQAVVQRMLGDRNAVNFIDSLIRQAPKLEKDRILRDKAQMDMPGGYEQSLVAFEAKWKDLMVALGSPMLGSATAALDALTKGIVNLTGWVNEHPDAVRNLGALGAGVATFAAIIGTLAIGAGIVGLMPGGVIIVGLAALAGGIAGLSTLNWKIITDGIEAWRTSDWNKIISDGLAKVITAFKDWIANLASAIKEALQGIWQNMKENLGSLFHFSSFGGGGGMGSSGALSAGERGQYASIIRKVAAQEGVDPAALLKIYGTEGASAWYGDGGKSFGPFQLYTGGGLGNQYTGDRSRSAHGVEEQARYVARYGKSHGGWSSDIWHGLRGGVGSIPYRRRGGGQGGGEQSVENVIILDGREIHRSVMGHASRLAQYPASAPYFDGSRSFTSPDHGLATV